MATALPLDWLFRTLTVIVLLRLAHDRRALQFTPFGRIVERLTGRPAALIERLGLTAARWQPASLALLAPVILLQAAVASLASGAALSFGAALFLAALAAVDTAYQMVVVALVLCVFAPPYTLDPGFELARRIARPATAPFARVGSGRALEAAAGFGLLVVARTGLRLLVLPLFMPGRPLAAAAPVEFLLGLLLAVQTYHFFVVLLLLAVLASWFPDAGGRVLLAVRDLAEPLFAPFRRWIPPFGRIDLTPMVVFLLIQLVFGRLEAFLRAAWLGYL